MKFTVILAALAVAAQAAVPGLENFSIVDTMKKINLAKFQCSALCIYHAVQGIESGTICDNIRKIEKGSRGCTSKCGVARHLNTKLFELAGNGCRDIVRHHQ